MSHVASPTPAFTYTSSRALPTPLQPPIVQKRPVRYRGPRPTRSSAMKSCACLAYFSTVSIPFATAEELLERLPGALRFRSRYGGLLVVASCQSPSPFINFYKMSKIAKGANERRTGYRSRSHTPYIYIYETIHILRNLL